MLPQKCKIDPPKSKMDLQKFNMGPQFIFPQNGLRRFCEPVARKYSYTCLRSRLDLQKLESQKTIQSKTWAVVTK